MPQKGLYLILVLLLTSCVGYHYTESGGVRVNNSNVFKYNKEKFRIRDKEGIDTGVIYIRDSTYDVWGTPKWELSNTAFVRFFDTGQVLFVYGDSTPTLDEMNNKDLGIPGYFIVDGTKLKIDMFQELNGGQTGKYFGRIRNNGDLILYEQRPETYYGSFAFLEKSEGKKRYSVWKKSEVKNLKGYEPEW